MPHDATNATPLFFRISCFFESKEKRTAVHRQLPFSMGSKRQDLLSRLVFLPVHLFLRQGIKVDVILLTYRRDSALSLHHPLLPILDIYSFSRGDDTYPLQVVANVGARTGTDRLDVTGHQFHRPVAGEFQHRVADVLALGFVASPGSSVFDIIK